MQIAEAIQLNDLIAGRKRRIAVSALRAVAEGAEAFRWWVEAWIQCNNVSDDQRVYTDLSFSVAASQAKHLPEHNERVTAFLTALNTAGIIL